MQLTRALMTLTLITPTWSRSSINRKWVSFTVHYKHRSSLTTITIRTTTRYKLRDAATKRLHTSPPPRKLLQLHTVQQRRGKIQPRRTCDVMNLSDFAGCSSRYSFPFLSHPCCGLLFHVCWQQAHVHYELTNRAAGKDAPFLNGDDTRWRVVNTAVVRKNNFR